MAKTSTSRTALAQRYAGALFALADDKKALDDVEKELRGLVDAYHASDDWQLIAGNPVITRTDKTAAMQAIAGKAGLSKLTTQFLTTLAEQARLELLPAIACAFSEQLNRARNIVVAQVTTAEKLGAAESKQVKALLDEATGKTVEVSATIDESMLGGIRVRLGSTMVDASLTHQLESLRRQLKQVAA